ncbi:M4 family metallopeptidase [Sphingosinicella sp. BN140058]|uniref:M4 family metallopeptidase n=1 Tax=Sphingosinicella sp. BN140058 TaxID=1892855 RepID=UPI0013E9EE8C|nr:M4 family metallopeptidase [Sphingosinicella sp. BN140058]
MSGLRGINANGFGQSYASRGMRALSSRLQRLERTSLKRERTAPQSARAADPDAQKYNLLLAERRQLRSSSSDAASRRHLETLLQDLDSRPMLAVTAPDRPERMPTMTTRLVGVAPDIDANTVTYQQSSGEVPIFGARVVVDVDRESKALVAVNGQLAPPPVRPAIARLSPIEAWRRLADWCAAPANLTDPAVAPTLTWYVDDAGTEYLTYRFRNTQLTPPKGDEVERDADPVACVRHARPGLCSYDYLVDAEDGSIRYYFASAPHFVPSPMCGIDCANELRKFYGLKVGESYILNDPQRDIVTYDYKFGNISEEPIPALPETAMPFPNHDIGDASPAAVSAHWHATLVFDFFNDVLKRNGIDDRGMKLVSVVNVYSGDDTSPTRPQWGNAAWWRNAMWYGQEKDATGTLMSFARHLDIIAHELTHGVTSSSSNLVYRDLPGALNESFSDIFGVFIANWYPEPKPVQDWNWEIGAGLGRNGGALRNFANPAAVGQPDHMRHYEPLPEYQDYGGVHRYSGIHNRAVHGIVTALDGDGQPIIPIRDAALLFYLTLVRLTPTSNFSAARRTLETVAGVYYADDPRREERLKAISEGYDAVGIV